MFGYKADVRIIVHSFRLCLKFILENGVAPNHSSRKRVKQGKKRKKSRFFDFQKKRKNVKKT